MTDWTRRVDDEGKAVDWVDRVEAWKLNGWHWEDVSIHEVPNSYLVNTQQLLADGLALVRKLSEDHARNHASRGAYGQRDSGLAKELRIAAMQRVIDGESG